MNIEEEVGFGAERLNSLVESAGLEIYPDSRILEKATILSPGTRISVTSSSSKGIEQTLSFAGLLKEKGFYAVPHIAARSIKDISHLESISAFLDKVGIEEVFVIAGDNKQPVGSYESSSALLEDLLRMTRTIRSVGVAGYPEGHPFIHNTELFDNLKAKVNISRRFGVSLHVDTQMCFDVNTIVNWIKYLRSQNLNLPVVLGIPVTSSLSKLIQFSARCGVGDSKRFLEITGMGKALHLVNYKPDGFLNKLNNAKEFENVVGLRIFTLNNIQDTLNWQKNFKLSSD